MRLNAFSGHRAETKCAAQPIADDAARRRQAKDLERYRKMIERKKNQMAAPESNKP